MSAPVRDLHPDRLSTTDEKGRRVYLYPAEAKGKFRKARNYVQAILMLIFLVVPWIHINGRQILFLNLSQRKFEIFGLTLRAHDGPGLVFVFGTLAFALLFVTAVWGRVWCGWACPQTVFIDGVFRRIEKWIEGSHLERRKLDAAPITLAKAAKKFAKWTLFILAAAVITHSFLAYFVGAKNLLAMITSPPVENWPSFLFILVTTGLVLFDFAWFREQFCTIVCPYGRLQSVLMDEQTQVVGYDFNRGEPRKSKASTGKTGDCVNCFRCVQVCPTGIDIRRGIQMECINCTACIDACDDVMTKTKKPTGLIRYTSENELNRKPVQRLRPRAVVYGVLLLLSLIGLTAFVARQQTFDMAWLRARGAPYELVQAAGQETVVNRFQVELTNKLDETRQMSFSILDSTVGIELVMAQNPYSLAPDKISRVDVFIKAPRQMFKNGTLKVNVEIRSSKSVEPQKKELTLVGPLT